MNHHLQHKVDFIRQNVLDVAIKNNKGHIAPALSKIEILVYLYYQHLKPEDRFIMSSGHSGYGLYAILADKGFIPKKTWEEFDLHGCLSRNVEYGILASTGSLGQGLSIACGIAYAKKIKNESGLIYCVIGDGELEEGQIWEALIFATHNKLDNLVLIVDNNKLRALDNCIFNEGAYISKVLSALGFCTVDVVDGNNIQDVEQAFGLAPCMHRPTAIILRTIKGKGLKCAEDVAKFHYRTPSTEELNG